MVKAQCLRDVAIKMNSSIDSTNVLVANLKPLYLALWQELLLARDLAGKRHQYVGI